MIKALSKTQTILFILLMILIGQSSIYLYLPSMPFMAKHFAVNNTSIQLTLSAYLLGFGCSQLIYGPLSAYFGRRPVLLVGLPIFLLSSIGCALAPSIEILLFFRLSQGLGVGATSVIARALMRDSFEGREFSKAASYMAMVWALAPMIVPAIGGYIQSYLGWQFNFIFLTLFAFTLCLFALVRLPESNKNIKTKPISISAVLQNYLSLLRHKTFVSNILCVIIVFSIFIVFNIAGPFLLQTQLGLSPVAYGWVLVIISFGYLIASYANNKIVRTWDPKKITQWGIYLLVLCSLLILLCTMLGYFSVIAIVLPMFLIMLSLGFIFANCITACLSPFPHMAGSASAMYGFLVFSGGCLVSAEFARFPAQTPLPLAISLVSLSLAMLVIFHIAISKPYAIHLNNVNEQSKLPD